MNKTAFLFPGQGPGSIKVGMGFGLEQSTNMDGMFEEAESLSKQSFHELCFNGPIETLLETRIAQPVSLIINLACAQFLNKSLNRRADFLAGHSAGYITALVYSGVISFHQGLTITLKRGELMGQACEETPGKMVVLIDRIDIDIGKIEEACNCFDIEIANCNSKREIVISGQVESVNEAVKYILKDGLVRKAIPLKVSGAFHSKHMKLASTAFGGFLEKITFCDDPGIPIVANSTAEIIRSKEEAKAELVTQLWSPVRWHESIMLLWKKGVNAFFEAGWGDVLSKNLRGDLKGEEVEIFSTQELLGKS